MRKILLLLPLFLWTCGGEPSKFDETAYVKTEARDRIKIVSFDYNDTTYDEVLQHAKKQMNTAGRMTAVYYFHKTDKMPLSGFSTTKSIFRANYVLRGMQVPAGQHTIEFKFEPKTYKTGESISLASSILLLLLLAFVSFKELKS